MPVLLESPEKQWLSIAEVMEMTGKTYACVYEWIRDGRVPEAKEFKRGGETGTKTYRVPRALVEEWREKLRIGLPVP